MSDNLESQVQQLKQRLAEKEREAISHEETLDAARSQIRSLRLELEIVKGHLTIAKASEGIAKTEKMIAEKHLEARLQEFDAFKKDIQKKKRKIAELLNDL